MYTLKTEAAFDSAHFLSGYEGKCRNIHGHRWRVVAEILSDRLVDSGQERGMLVDFSQFKKVLKEEADILDHALIIEKGSLPDELYNMLCGNQFRIISLEFRPTAENLSEYFYRQLSGRGFRVKEVCVYETPNNCAAYSE
ncbi:MAG: 6-pyruvoyl trahydropterin synthase family protein [Oscillospiraceae bacterium]|nr:6-carboxytetrahydropterin synthase [Oscillospiraceae bacterium]